MNLRETTRDILSQVEQLTGFPVEVIEDRSLQTTAVVQMASRRTVPANIVRTNPATGQPPDYLISAANAVSSCMVVCPRNASRLPTRCLATTLCVVWCSLTRVASSTQ